MNKWDKELKGRIDALIFVSDTTKYLIWGFIKDDRKHYQQDKRHHPILRRAFNKKEIENAIANRG